MENLNIAVFYKINKFAGVSEYQDQIIVFLASHLAYVLLSIFVIWLLKNKLDNAKKLRVFLEALFASIIGRGFAVEITRFFYHHERPFVALSSVNQLLTEHSYSFPSGHATLFFGLSTVIYKYNNKLGWLFYIASTVMGIARIASGVHYPADIIGGAIFGITFGYLSFVLVERALNKFLKDKIK